MNEPANPHWGLETQVLEFLDPPVGEWRERLRAMGSNIPFSGTDLAGRKHGFEPGKLRMYFDQLTLQQRIMNNHDPFVDDSPVPNLDLPLCVFWPESI